MSCGQKAWAEEVEEKAFRDGVDKMKMTGYEKIYTFVEQLEEVFVQLEKHDITALSRSGWRKVDKIKELLRAIKGQ